MVVVTPLLGLIVAEVVKYGVLFDTVTLPAPVSVPPSESVAVAVQAIESDGDAVELVRVKLELVPRVLVPFVQA